jgi:short-subunit dehydrogenase involved in D-alanine esterification of teichoic acids
MPWQYPYPVAGRKALITGASKEIGAEIAAVFDEAGADIVALGRGTADLAATAEAVRAHGRQCLTLVAEMATPTEPVAACKRALTEWGTIDISVNSAGIALVDTAEEFATEDWDKMMSVNLRAPFLTARTLASAMIAQRWGKVVNISSQTGVIAMDDHAAYASSQGRPQRAEQVALRRMGAVQRPGERNLPDRRDDAHGGRSMVQPEKGDPFRNATPARRFAEPVEVADAALLMVEGGFTSV